MSNSKKKNLYACLSWCFLVISALYLIIGLVTSKASSGLVSFHVMHLEIAPDFYDAVHIVLLLPFYLILLVSLVLLLIACLRGKLNFFSFSWILAFFGNFYLLDRITVETISMQEMSVEVKNPLIMKGWGIFVSLGSEQTALAVSLLPYLLLVLISAGLFFVAKRSWKNNVD